MYIYFAMSKINVLELATFMQRYYFKIRTLAKKIRPNAMVTGIDILTTRDTVCLLYTERRADITALYGNE